MLVLITYDVNTELMRGKNVYVKSPNNVPTTEDGCKILYSNVYWIMHSVLY